MPPSDNRSVVSRAEIVTARRDHGDMIENDPEWAAIIASLREASAREREWRQAYRHRDAHAAPVVRLVSVAGAGIMAVGGGAAMWQAHGQHLRPGVASSVSFGQLYAAIPGYSDLPHNELPTGGAASLPGASNLVTGGTASVGWSQPSTGRATRTVVPLPWDGY
jgi:hypothetical protein